MTAPVAIPLDEAVSVILDAAGNGMASIGPASTRAVWTITGAATSTSTNVKEAVFDLFQNSKASKLGGTYTGSNDQIGFAGGTVVLRHGRLLGYWTGGDPGALATLSLTGSITIGG